MKRLRCHTLKVFGGEMHFVSSDIPTACVDKAIKIMVLDAVHIYEDQPPNAHAAHCLSGQCADTTEANNSDL